MTSVFSIRLNEPGSKLQPLLLIHLVFCSRDNSFESFNRIIDFVDTSAYGLKACRDTTNLKKFFLNFTQSYRAIFINQRTNQLEIFRIQQFMLFPWFLSWQNYISMIPIGTVDLSHCGVWQVKIICDFLSIMSISAKKLTDPPFNFIRILGVLHDRTRASSWRAGETECQVEIYKLFIEHNGYL